MDYSDARFKTIQCHYLSHHNDIIFLLYDLFQKMFNNKNAEKSVHIQFIDN